MCNACAIAKLNKKGMEALNEGEFGIAEDLLNSALVQAQKMDSVMYQARILHNLSLVHQCSGNESDAVLCLRLAMGLADKKITQPNKFINRLQARLRQLQAA